MPSWPQIKQHASSRLCMKLAISYRHWRKAHLIVIGTREEYGRKYYLYFGASESHVSDREQACEECWPSYCPG